MFVSVAIAAVAAWVLFQTFQRISLADVVRSMQSVPVERVLLAGVCVVALYILLPAFEIAAVRYVKDNRLLPEGFDKSTAERAIAVHGGAATDSDFAAGSDAPWVMRSAARCSAPARFVTACTGLPDSRR